MGLLSVPCVGRRQPCGKHGGNLAPNHRLMDSIAFQLLNVEDEM